MTQKTVMLDEKIHTQLIKVKLELLNAGVDSLRIDFKEHGVTLEKLSYKEVIAIGLTLISLKLKDDSM